MRTKVEYREFFLPFFPVFLHKSMEQFVIALPMFRLNMILPTKANHFQSFSISTRDFLSYEKSNNVM